MLGQHSQLAPHFGFFSIFPLEGRGATLGPKGRSKAGEGVLRYAQ